MEMKNGVLKSDYDALVALYNSANGPGWRHNEGWLTDKPVSEWYGVTVDGGRVIGLYLSNNELTGKIPPEIGNLTKLKGLYLYNNQLTGGLPESVKLPNCKILV